MTSEQVNTAIGMCAVDLTRHIMDRSSLTPDAAYRQLLETRTYSLLNDPDTRLYLESDEFLRKCYDIETAEGENALYEFISPEP